MPDRKGTILVIDDDPDIREALCDTLTDNGYQVGEASDGAEALEWLRDNPPPCLIFIDWNMTPMNAPQFMAEFVKNPAFAHVPVVLITADMHAPQKVTTGRYKGYISKPLDIDAMLAILAQYTAKPGPAN